MIHNLEHYIKIKNVKFDHKNNKIKFSVFLNISKGETGIPDIDPDAVLGNLSKMFFKSISIDTSKTFVCSSGPSDMATRMINIKENDARDYEYQLRNKLSNWQNNVSYIKSVENLTPNTQSEYEFDIYYSDRFGNRLTNPFDLNYFDRYLVWDIELDLNDMNVGSIFASDINEEMYFIYVDLTGEYMQNSSNVLRMMPKQTMFVIYDKDALYENIYNTIFHTKHDKCCPVIDVDSANKVVFLHGFVSSLKMFKWKDALKFWKLIHKNKNIKNSCSCNGR